MSQVSSREPLFEPGFIRALEALSLAGRRVPTGHAAGQWRSRAIGASVEFSDYRTYAPGDEFRRIDWSAYARLERLFVRLYRAEEDLSLQIVLDTSSSMDWGKPSKARLAAQLAGALAFVGLHSGDHVEITTLRDGHVGDHLSGLRGQAAASSAWRWLEALEPGGATDLNASLSACARQARGMGLTLVVSDLFSSTGYQRGLEALHGRRRDLVLVHVLAPDELEPPADLVGEWRLIDTEPAAPVEASITPNVVRAYRRLLATFSQEVDDFCRRRGITYLQLRSDTHLTDVVLRTLRTLGVVT